MKKNVLKPFALIAMVLMIFTSAVAQDPRTIVFVRDAGNANIAGEDVVRDALVAQFATDQVIVTTNANITTYSATFIDTLQNAHLIVLARAVGSWNWNSDAHRVAWNAIRTPILSTNAFAIRAANLGWIATGAARFGGAAGSTTVFNAFPRIPADPVLAGIPLTGDSIALWAGHWTIAGLDVNVPHNATVVLDRMVVDNELQVVLARWTAGVPFFEGGTTPAGHRAYFGLGADGGGVVNYWGWNFNGHDILFREMERLMALPRIPDTSIGEAPVKASVSVAPNPVTDVVTVRMSGLASVKILDVTGKLVKSVSAGGSDLSVDLGNLPAGVYFVKATDSSNNTSVERIIKR